MQDKAPSCRNCRSQCALTLKEEEMITVNVDAFLILGLCLSCFLVLTVNATHGKSVYLARKHFHCPKERKLDVISKQKTTDVVSTIYSQTISVKFVPDTTVH